MEALGVASPPASPVQTETIQRRRASTLTQISHMPGPLNKKNYATGIVLLLAVVFLWTASNFVTQHLFADGYEKPFMITYLCTSSFTFYLIPFGIRRKFGKERKKSLSRSPMNEYQPLTTSDSLDEHDDRPISSSREDGVDIQDVNPELPPLNVQQTAELAFAFCLVWFAANWSLNASLDYTSVASATILSSTSGFFTLGIGRIFKVERFTNMKILAVFTSFLGVLLVSLSDSNQTSKPSGQSLDTETGTYSVTTAPENNPTRQLLGDILALASALLYSIYVTLLKVRVKNESRVDMQLFFGFVGLFNVLGCWPIGVLLHVFGVERFAWPTGSEWYAVIINMVITLSSDYIYVIAMLKTTPLVVTVGLSLTIPTAVLGDYILNIAPVKVPVLAGATLVLLSFIAIGTDNSNTDA